MHAREGEVTAIIGDNGAGKSSLVKCVLGVNRPTGGTMRFRGEEVTVTSPHHAKELGIEAVFQDLALFDDLRLWQNMFIGRELRRGFGPLSLLRKKEMASQADTMVRPLAVNVPRRTAHRAKHVRRPATGRRHRPGGRLGLRAGDHGRADRRARCPRDAPRSRSWSCGSAARPVLPAHQPQLRPGHEAGRAVWVMRQGRAVAHRRVADTSGQELVALVTGAKEAEL